MHILNYKLDYSTTAHTYTEENSEHFISIATPGFTPILQDKVLEMFSGFDLMDMGTSTS